MLAVLDFMGYLAYFATTLLLPRVTLPNSVATITEETNYA
ncbi:hypothetical protein COO91_01253 [Nostoc flagelliforme CCNUN1]|uniref:Uncharacterized protein n=1 Tax=Nostoc flagelliforme CCNUN1 TaxID=2038116 RepID=A0A2K8SKK4_9NOSO|nr:hypothetical protein COO91_01253 [Nostoc flagelliforme CCNUN1]